MITVLEFLDFFISGINSIVSALDRCIVFSVFSLWDLMIASVVLCIVAAVFWKGAKG